MARPKNFGTRELDQTLQAIQGTLVMSIFIFFNTTYAFFGKNFALWGQFIIFPAFIISDIIMTLNATAQYLDRTKAHSSTHSMAELRLMLASHWLKTSLVIFSGLAGLGLMPSATLLSPLLMVLALGQFCIVSLGLIAYQGLQQSEHNNFNKNQFIYEHRHALIGILLLSTVICCVTVANFIPALIVQIPHLSPLTVLIGAMAGAGTIAHVFFRDPASGEQNAALTLPNYDPQQLLQEFRRIGCHTDSNLVNQRLLMFGQGDNHQHTHGQDPCKETTLEIKPT